MSLKCEAMHACSFSLVFFLFFFEIKMKKLRIKIQLLLETSLCLTKQWLSLWMADLSTTNFIRSTNMRWFYKLKTRLLLQFQATLSLCKMFHFFRVWWIIIVAQCICLYFNCATAPMKSVRCACVLCSDFGRFYIHNDRLQTHCQTFSMYAYVLWVKWHH